MKRLSVAILLFALISIYCEKDTSPLTNIPEGAFEYYGYDTSGDKIYTGWLKINFEDSTSLTGNWEFFNKGNGELTGSVIDANISLWLLWDDPNNRTRLKGKLETINIKGTWLNWSYLFVGDSGTFKAIKPN
jgi:hypothetical protein